MESTKKMFQGPQLLLSTSPFRFTTLRCTLQLHHHHYHTPIQIANLVSVTVSVSIFLIWSAIIFWYTTLDLESLFSKSRSLHFPPSPHTHTLSSPYQSLYLIVISSSCILYPISALLISVSVHVTNTCVIDRCSHYTTLICVLQ